MINNRQNGRRRGRGGAQVRGGPNGGNGGNRIDNRARGNAAQLYEKYKNLARDAQTQGDRVMTEYYLQFADHYFRVLNENRARFEEQGQQRRPRFESEDDEDGMGDGEDGNDRDEAAERRPEREPRSEPRREREPAPVEAVARPRREAGEEAGEPDRESSEGDGRRRRRLRGPRPEVAGEGERIEFDRLPPSVSAGEERPVRTPRVRRNGGEAEAGGYAAAEPVPSLEGEEAPTPRRRRARRTPDDDATVAAA